MTMLKTERKHPTVTSCPDCGHDVYPLYSQLAVVPLPRQPHGCLVAMDGTRASGGEPCGCHHDAHLFG
ncbi:hypothetical protein FB382_000114 [Nocardioides ginsengisegetis]|uniref:Uncharacterized protein n=1 Tax=Nocardioides ginsengisegetis TaxID=661491 RepID=A0A7W3P7W2_9ACTN|nr:hypothetical protein [Nocardioides ginsengisegetis]MBA8801823.1 hypothetical protein [Nocardioides ginsengisegetis]